MNRLRRAPNRSQRGVSLLEFMISMGLGLILIATIGNAYLGAKRSFRGLDALSRIQEGARYAFEFMGAEARMAGFSGGPTTVGNTTNVVNAPGANTWNPGLKHLFVDETVDTTHAALMGQEDTNGAFLVDFDNDGNETDANEVCPGNPGDTAGCYLRGDLLTIVHADNDCAYAVTAHTAPDFTVACPGNATCNQNLPAAGEILVVADHTRSAVFQVSAASAETCSSGSFTVSHNTGTVTPGNSGTALNFPDAATVTARRLYRLKGVIFYIGKNPGGEPALYQKRLSHTGTAASSIAEELVEGVEDMQITYGVDATDEVDGEGNPDPDWAVQAYWTADAVSAGSGPAPGGGTLTLPDDGLAATPTIPERWQRVLSVRVSLLMASRSDENVTGGAQTYTFNGVTTTPSDGLLRKVFTTTLAVRNRLP